MGGIACTYSRPPAEERLKDPDLGRPAIQAAEALSEAMDKARGVFQGALTHGDPDANRMPLLEHLRELRYRVLVSAGALLVGVFVGIFFEKPVEHFVTAPIRVLLVPKADWNPWDAWYARLTSPLAAWSTGTIDGHLSITGATEGMYVWMNMGLIAGVMLAAPIIAWQGWQFVAPGLYGTERRVVIPLTFASTLLFLVGATFCYLVIFPVSFPFFLQAVDATPNISIDNYLETFMWMMASFGLCFQLPIGVFFLARIGLIDHRDMIHFFRYSVVIIFIVAAVLTPQPDVLSQSLLAVPLLALYVVGILVARIFSTKVRTE
jgi:sec-independent protein translocase protein TatC